MKTTLKFLIHSPGEYQTRDHPGEPEWNGRVTVEFDHKIEEEEDLIKDMKALLQEYNPEFLVLTEKEEALAIEAARLSAEAEDRHWKEEEEAYDDNVKGLP